MPSDKKIVPLSQWKCDVCGGVVTVDDGYVVWDAPASPNHSFQIIHKVKCDRNDRKSNMPLSYFLGPDGLAVLTSMLSYGIVHTTNRSESAPPVPELNQFVDFLRRVQIPGYEEARDWLQSREAYDDLNDANEVYPYVQSSLSRYAL
jgi:hypothetical protein